MFRTICSSCGHTNTNDDLTTTILELRHDPLCDCFKGMPLSYPSINLSLIKEDNPKYIKAYREDEGRKSNEK